ncbi:hypothetical protein QAD02_014123 [Eretmocerus hayati]|uniref:Uncharacterized protein n=1 Tax=Eretmocerus hayati TaxID=131215 RepID=A0ACC2P4I4_9HYME|nr:hypothetical protein QAD02_014123 [Eretmocerus hayati]
MERRIRVECRDQPPLSFKTLDGYISLSYLMNYIPHAVGLRYIQGNDVEVIDGKLQLDPDIAVYQAIYDDERIGPLLDGNLDDILTEYFFCRYKYSEICALLKKNHNVTMSIRTLKRHYKRLNLRRWNMEEATLLKLITCILVELGKYIVKPLIRYTLKNSITRFSKTNPGAQIS